MNVGDTYQTWKQDASGNVVEITMKVVSVNGNCIVAEQV